MATLLGVSVSVRKRGREEKGKKEKKGGRRERRKEGRNLEEKKDI